MPPPRRLPYERVSPVFSRQAALAAGFTDHQLSGQRVVRLGYGWYAENDSETSLLFGAVAACPTAVLCDVTALRIWRLPVPWSRRDDHTLHLCVPAPADPPQRAGIIAHQRIIRDGDKTVIAGLPVTSPQRTFLDLAATVELEDLVGIGDAMLNAGITSMAELAARVSVAARQRGVRKARDAIQLLDGRAQSMPESIIRVRIISDRLPTPEPQCPVWSSAGLLVAQTDLGYPAHRVAVEHEGRHHAEPTQFAIDTRRYTDISAAGWLILRSSANDLSAGSYRLLGNLRQTLLRRGWRPSP
jgi:hypothetical protein